MCTRPNMVSVRGHVIPCSCGKCAECVTKRQSSFGIRGTEEMRNWKTTVFVTLTLDDDHIRYKKLGDLLDDCSANKRLAFDKSFYKRNGRFPLDSEYPADVFDTDSNIDKCSELLDKRPQKDFPRYQQGYDFMHSERLNRDTLIAVPDKAEFSLFIKRLRQNIVNSLFPRHMDEETHKWIRDKVDLKKCAIKYIYGCEYGPNTLRPHYHLVFYTNLTYWRFVDILRLTWQKGFDKCYQLHCDGEETNAAISYVAKYLFKPEWFENPYVSTGIVPRPHRGFSHGIGLSYVDRVVKKNLAHIDCVFAGKIKGDYYGYNRDYLQAIQDSFRVVSGGYFYALPRYYKEKILPQTEKMTFSIDYKTRTKNVRKVKRTDSAHPFCIALTANLLDRIDEQMDRDFKLYREAHKEQTFADSACSYEIEISNTLRERDKVAAKRLRDAYWKKARKFSM